MNQITILISFALLTSCYADTNTTHEHEEHTAAGEAWIFSMSSVVVISLISLCGAALLLLREQTAKRIFPLMIALSCGTFLGSCFFTLFPECAHLLGFDAVVGSVALAGVMFGYLFEKILHSHFHSPVHTEHGEQYDNNTHNHGFDAMLENGEKKQDNPDLTVPSGTAASHIDLHSDKSDLRHIAFLNVIGDCIHNFVDGGLIAATYLASISSGLTVSIAVALHELPQEIGDFCVLMHTGLSPKEAILYNLLASLTAIVGAVIVLVLDESTGVSELTNWLIPFAAGQFLYIALSGLVPEMQKIEHRRKWAVSLFVFVGIGLMAATLLLPHDHAGHDHDH